MLSNQPSSQVADSLQEQARAKQSAATSSAKSQVQLHKVDEVGSTSYFKRLFRLIVFGIIPLIACVWFILSWATQCSPTPAAALAVKPIGVTPLAGSVDPTPKVVGSLFDQAVSRPPSLYGAPGSASVPAAVVVPAVRCYAREDVTGIYSATQVLEGGLFLAEKYSRVRGGLIFNSRYGWYAAGHFGCAEGLDQVEVEFTIPTTPTPPATAKPRAPAVVRTATPIALPSAIPSPTMASGIVSFSAPSCDLVSYLAWNVKAVYLIRSGQKMGVPGDNGGAPIITSVCPFTGTLTLAVVGRDGQVVSRSVNVQ